MKRILLTNYLIFVPMCLAHAEMMSESQLQFYGSVTATSCKIDIDNQSHTNINLPSIPINELYNLKSESYVKSKGFYVTLFDCFSSKVSDDDKRTELFDVYWIDSYALQSSYEKTSGEFLNLSPDGAKNIALALSVENDEKQESKKKIKPISDSQAKSVAKAIAADKIRYQYYIGYSINDVHKIKPGPIVSYAVYNINYY
ncbi:fimbrial protein [Orbus mooreae]|uniref:fimbrial protein n=1 Tax=Orbus mooreae TaxID=3074107 RepID=UPI00370D4D4C